MSSGSNNISDARNLSEPSYTHMISLASSTRRGCRHTFRMLPSGSLYSSILPAPPPAHSFSSFFGSSATKQVFSFIRRTTSFSADVWKIAPDFRSNTCRCSVTSRPATSIRRIAAGIAKPSYTGTAWETPSPESRTIPVVRPEAYLTENTFSKLLATQTEALVASRREQTAPKQLVST